MSNAKLIIKNTGILVFGEILSRVFSFFLIIFIARYLGNVGLGKYSFIFAFVGIFSIMSDLGTTVYMTREIARNKSVTKEYLGKVFVLKVMASSLSVLMPLIFIMFTTQTSEIKAGVLLACIAIFFNYMAFPFRAVVNAYEVQQYQSIYSFVERLTAFALGVFVLSRGYGLMGLLFALVASNIVSWIVLYALVSRKISALTPKIDFKFINFLLKESFPFWFTTIFMTIYFKIDTVMLSFMKGYAATGWYNASYKIIDTLSFLPFVVVTAIFPAMSKFHRDSKLLLKILYEKSFYYMAILALPLGLGATLLADRIIWFVYKQEFANSIVVLQILIWALVFIFVNYLMGYLLNSIEKQKLFTLTTGLCAVLNIALNLFLIPLYSFIGASVATVITELFNFSMLYYFTSKNGLKIDILRIILKPALATALMGLFVVYLSGFHLLLLIPSSILFYFSILFIIGGIREEDKKLLLSFAGIK
ncbi:flippase [Candidatus Woesearchaeota archaeon]|nr:flippase [Candidatus Woesearchaeota archaeon]